MNISKMGTEQLRKAITNGKFEGDQLTAAKANLAKRDAKKKANPDGPVAQKEPKKAAPKKKVKKVAPVKKDKAEEKPTEKAIKTLEDYTMDKKTVSGLVRSLLMPKDGTKVAGCSFSEAKAQVVKKFERDLYPSEFDRNFKVLKSLGLVETKRPPRYKGDIEGGTK